MKNDAQRLHARYDACGTNSKLVMRVRMCRTPQYGFSVGEFTATTCMDKYTSRVANVREGLGLTWPPADPIPLSLAQASSLYVPSPLPSGSAMRLSCPDGSIASSSTCKVHQHKSTGAHGQGISPMPQVQTHSAAIRQLTSWRGLDALCFYS